MAFVELQDCLDGGGFCHRQKEDGETVQTKKSLRRSAFVFAATEQNKAPAEDDAASLVLSFAHFGEKGRWKSSTWLSLQS